MGTTSSVLESMDSDLTLRNVRSSIVFDVFFVYLFKYLFGFVTDIAPEDITNILSRLSRHPYITQEVVDTASDAVFSNRHASAGDVQEFVSS